MARGAIVVAAFATHAALAAPALPTQIGGALPLTDTTILERWHWTSSWSDPVGLAGDSAGPEDTYHVLRGVERDSQDVVRHQGVDLGNGSPGGNVRAAASGLVIVAAANRGNGYGDHVVVAHRRQDGSILYSVYAHLATGSIRVKPGDEVARGEALACVGRTGRASTDHLHFELRRAQRPDGPWERATVVDPLAFIHEHGAAVAGGTGPHALVAWAAGNGMLDAGARPGERLLRGVWWRMLAVATRLPLWRLPDDPAELREALVAARLLPSDAPHGAHDAIDRRECGAALEPLTHACRAADLTPPPARADSSSSRAKHPTVADGCALLARLVGAPVVPAADAGER